MLSHLLTCIVIEEGLRVMYDCCLLVGLESGINLILEIDQLNAQILVFK
jgi:hypothetical protein